ncbi:MAG: hypothetical protein HFI48_15710 [Lachnospiraceae bacterium]|nr:hypothetical protein [Lachnospiraceae bacterium]
MECTYTIQDGELLQNNSKENIMAVYTMFLLRFLRFLALVLTFGMTMYLTYVIFRECITEATLGNCIPLGSIFATFGSAVISVLSLYCNKQKDSFLENLSALHEQIPELSAWKRWPFFKRYDMEKTGLWKFDYYILKNPRITFQSADHLLAIALPTCTADFYDLPILAGIIKMTGFGRHLSGMVFCMKSVEQKSILSVFHCTMMIYRNIIRYKAGAFFMLIGSEFVIASIIFSFFYRPVSEFILLMRP